MSTPQRIQRKRTKGWRMPEDAVYVGRPSRWANPFKVERSDAQSVQYGEWFVDDVMGVVFFATQWDAARFAVWVYRADLRREMFDLCVDDVRRELAGRDLACWCKPGDPCHADVLLELANAPEAVPA